MRARGGGGMGGFRVWRWNLKTTEGLWIKSPRRVVRRQSVILVVWAPPSANYFNSLSSTPTQNITLTFASQFRFCVDFGSKHPPTSKNLNRWNYTNFPHHAPRLIFNYWARRKFPSSSMSSPRVAASKRAIWTWRIMLHFSTPLSFHRESPKLLFRAAISTEKVFN